MYQVGIVNFEGELSESPSQELVPSNWAVSQTDLENTDAYDLIILLEHGVEYVGKICGQLMKVKREMDALIWVWSTSQNEMNRMVYLKLGADGIITEMLNKEEWLLIMENALKRSKQENLLEDPAYDSTKQQVCGITMNHRNRSLISGENEEVQLTSFEYKIMDLLYQNAGETVTYDEIYQAVWKNEASDDKKFYRISNLVFHIRKKLEDELGTSEAIRTVRSKGYVLNI